MPEPQPDVSVRCVDSQLGSPYFAAMEYFPNLPAGSFADPASWAERMEHAGWHGLCASDHILVGANPYPHVFVTAAALATATSRCKITTSFANNLLRSPVEFAQAALSLQLLSDGRFEAGLGAGWAAHELHAMGLHYPEPRERVDRYVEALQIARSLLRSGQCQFAGEHYQIDITDEFALGPRPPLPPPLIASAGGPRAIRATAPLVDRLEIKASARSTRGGELHLPTMASVTEDEIKANVERVQQAAGDLPIGIFILIGVGQNAAVAGLKEILGDGYLGRFVGHQDDVARALESLGELGIDRVQLTELVPGSQDQLGPALLAAP